MAYAFGSLDELGEGYGFRKIRTALGVTAFGVNALVYPPGAEGILHYHDTQDELYFVHRGRVKVDVEGESRELGEGGLFHAEGRDAERLADLAEAGPLAQLVQRRECVAHQGSWRHMAGSLESSRRPSSAETAASSSAVKREPNVSSISARWVFRAALNFARPASVMWA